METKVILLFDEGSKRFDCYDEEGKYVTTLTSGHGLTMFNGWGIRYDGRVEYSHSREGYYFCCEELGFPMLAEGLSISWKVETRDITD